MSITPDGWFDFAERRPGPADKIYSMRNSGRGYIPHSAVGFYPGWASRLFSTARDAQGRYTPYAAASVHGWIAYDGHVIQHYPITASCWASGSYYPNCNFIAFENEGGVTPHMVNEPLRPGQIDANARIIRELSAFKGWTPRRPANGSDRTASLYEHRECIRFGSLATACPSERIPWAAILQAVEEEDEMLKDEVAALKAALAALAQANAGSFANIEKRLTDLEAKVK